MLFLACKCRARIVVTGQAQGTPSKAIPQALQVQGVGRPLNSLRQNLLNGTQLPARRRSERGAPGQKGSKTIVRQAPHTK